MYSDNAKKFITVLNEKFPIGVIVNAVGHLTTGFVSKLTDPTAAEFLDYRGADGITQANISKWPFIVLAARNGNQIRTLRQSLLGAGLPAAAFSRQMIGESAEAQMAAVAGVPEGELEYIGLVTFGESQILDGLVKKFSLFRGSKAAESGAPSEQP